MNRAAAFPVARDFLRLAPASMITAAIRLRPFGLLDAATVAAWLDGPGLGLPAGPVGSRWAERLIADARVRAWVAVVGHEPVAFVRLDVGPDRVAELTLAVAPG